MKLKTVTSAIFALLFSVGAVSGANAAVPTAAAEPIKVILFGAHPDDCDINAGGIAALYSQAGHEVKFVSMTNGNKGHHQMKPNALAARRKGEMREAGRILGIEYTNMDNDDGELMPTLENRLEVIRLIRDWGADVVITHRPNDYHPDHRYCSQVVQDAAYMISVPLLVPEVDALMKPVVFLYMPDRFQKPNPFSPDIVVDVTPVMQKKVDAICAHESQVFEWLPWNNGYADQMPASREEQRRFIGERYLGRNQAERYGQAALKWYTAEQIADSRYFESFEVCEYGSMPSRERILELFPMLPR
ncbi:MAG: PIG-L family deacetylase [Alistipes sp.]|jgi:LmbE family N-acetylglucosaminyl deacetylase|nr:PIG-L family deacetylase [Alistipes sp.]